MYWIYGLSVLLLDKNANPKGKNNAEEQQGEIQNLEDESEFFSSKKMKEDNKKKISGTCCELHSHLSLPN
jgi:hypothetical protein